MFSPLPFTSAVAFTVVLGSLTGYFQWHKNTNKRRWQQEQYKSSLTVDLLSATADMVSSEEGSTNVPEALALDAARWLLAAVD